MVTKNYGYPTVVNYLTQNTLIPIANLSDDPETTEVEPHVENGKLVIPPSGYVKLLLPGACSTAWSMNGVFLNANETSFHYTLDSLNTTDPAQYMIDLPTTAQEDGGKSFTLNGTTLAKGQTYDILFEERTSICKIVDGNPDGGKVNGDGKFEHPFALLTDAWDYIETQHSADSSKKTWTIEMLMDYQQPGTDVLTISEGYDITLTTAAPRGTEGVPYTYYGADATRATISRDNTNEGAAVIASDPSSDNYLRIASQCTSSLTIKNLIFDGKALAKSGNGGAISTENFIVTIESSEFKGCQANRGGAIFANGGALTVTDSNFANCYTKASTDKCGGGAIWTTAQVLTISGKCIFDNCACNVTGNAQGGAVFHNIRYDYAPIYPNHSLKFPVGYSADSVTNLTGCIFKDCFSVDGSGGTVESDAWVINLTNCEFHGSYTGKNNGNGGALNAYTNDNYTKDDNGNNNVAKIDSRLTISGCVFEDCSARRGTSTLGGAIRTKTRTTLIENSTFKDCWSCKGGVIYNDVGSSEISLTINNCRFENCSATVEEGVAYTAALTLGVEDSAFKNCSAPAYGCIRQNRNSTGSEATVKNSKFEKCVSTNGSAGALHTTALTLEIIGQPGVVTFKDCSATGIGGAVYHSGSTEKLTNTSFDSCESGGNGGGAYLSAVMTFDGVSVTNCKAVDNGGGLYLKPTGSTSALTNCTFSGNTLSATESKGGSLYIEQNNLAMTNCSFGNSTAAYGGGVYHNGGTLSFNGGSISNCKALISGGGLYSANTCYLGYHESEDSAVNISNCYAVTSGGGVYHSSNMSLRNVDIDACYAGQGGGIYSTYYLDVNTATYRFTINDCHAKGVSLDADGTPAVAEEYQSGNLGGGICKASTSNWNLKSANGVISGCSAYDGGGIYYGVGGTLAMSAGSITGNTAAHDGGGIYQNAGTINYSGGTVSKNTATGNGGGFYKADGTFTMSGGTVGGSSDDDANTAAYGAGVFVGSSQMMTMSGGSITYNKATTAGGGIAVGATPVGAENAKLQFQGTVLVQNNTMPGAEEGKVVACNVYLDQDNNGIINTTKTELNAASYIGVYCSNEQDPTHGLSGMPFGTYNNSNNLNRFYNDRRPYYYGIKGKTENQIIWCSYVCKITDGDGNLLFKDATGSPAAYMTLENSGGTARTNAFGTLANSDPELYTENGVKYTGSTYQVQMLVPEYEVMGQIKLITNKNITLTTADPEADDGFPYTGGQKNPVALITRGQTYGSMFNLDSNSPNLTLKDIIIDGGSKIVDGVETGYTSNSAGGILYLKSGSATIGTGATIQNSNTDSKNGGGIRMESSSGTFTIDGGTISNCRTTAYGGGISLKTGTLVMNSGTITGCQAAYGGGVRSDTTFYMNGGTITGNNATTDGGGISIDTNYANNRRVYFSGKPVVIGNTLNGTTSCNVQMGQDRPNAGVGSSNYASAAIINASGLENGAEIGVYVSDDQLNNHGIEGKPFGLWTDSTFNAQKFTEDDRPYCFVNDRNNVLRGSQGAEDDKRIYWALNYLLTIDTAVESDLAADHEAEFEYTIRVDSENVKGRSFSGISFNGNGEGKLTMKDADTPFTIHFPETINTVEGQKTAYTVTVNSVKTNPVVQLSDFDTSVSQNMDTTHAYTGSRLSVSGKLGENLDNSPPSGRSTVTFTHTRHTGDLSVAKTVVSDMDKDRETIFRFALTLADTGISQAYEAWKKTGENEPVEMEGGVEFSKGRAAFELGHGESITIKGLPTDLGYTVAEDLSENLDRGRIRTKTVWKVTEADEEVDNETSGISRTGTLGEHWVTNDGKTLYTSDVTFTNSYLKIVCKITNRSRALLYYKEDDGKLVPAVFDSLADAFAKVNSGGLRTSSDGNVSGLLRIEMVVPDYEMDKPAVLDSGKTVVLSTAFTTDTDGYPYTGQAGSASVVKRGEFPDSSMITDHGVLTLDKITLDGGAVFDDQGTNTGRTSTADGSIVKADAAVKLTVNADARLLNADTTGNGGAIWLHSGATLAMNGAVEDCQAANGGGIYADTGFSEITVTGTNAETGLISGCRATSGNGGGICAASGNKININNGTRLIKNSALNGGAIYTNAYITLRGQVGGSEEERNTATNGGGLYIGSNATFIMYSTGSIANNTASEDGGGLYAVGTARVSGGAVSNNEAKRGGGVYIADGASLAVSSTFTHNKAAQGGAVYDGGTMSITGGIISANEASEKGGAVYVADAKTFSMSGGSVNDGNKSPEGAISTGATSVLTFSGGAVVSGNFGSDGTTPMNVFLGYDSNDIIQTTGLGSKASIGVYVTNGEDNSILYDHGIAARNFGTYTGTTPDSAYLKKFHNDRDAELDGIAGDAKTLGTSSPYFVMWPGKSLYIQLNQFDVKTESDGTPVHPLDGEGNPIPDQYVPVEDPAPIKGASFTLTNVKTEERVWSGQSSNRSGSEGLITIPWSKIEATGNNTAIFAKNNYYKLEQSTTDANSVLPGGSWLLHIEEGNRVVWQTIEAWQTLTVSGETVTLTPETKPEDAEQVNRTFEASLAPGGTGNLGDTFILYNDRRPKIIYKAGKGKIHGTNDNEKTEIVRFGSNKFVEYTINEDNPLSNTIFLNWNTVQNPDEDNPGVIYMKGNKYRFYRHSDFDDLILYAQWVPVVCKITDFAGNLLYLNGEKAIYAKLEDAFRDFTSKVFTNSSGKGVTASYLKMLVDTYDLEEPLILKRSAPGTMSGTLTTATSNAAVEGEYPFYSDTGKTVCTINRDFDENASMITLERFQLRLADITLDGGAEEGKTVSADGGIVKVVGRTQQLYIQSGATLQNSGTTGKGGAVCVSENGSVTMTGGTIRDNSAVIGGAVFIDENGASTMNGGVITANSATDKGGAVFVNKSSAFTMTGGAITANSSTNGGAVDFADVSSRLNLGGTPTIYDNMAGENQKNVVLIGDGANVNNIVNVTSALNSNARVGIYDASGTKDHRNMGELFGSYNGDFNQNLSIFRNDIYTQLSGVQAGEPNRISWGNLIPVEIYEYDKGHMADAEALDPTYEGIYTFYDLELVSVGEIIAGMVPACDPIGDGYAYVTAKLGDVIEVVEVSADGSYKLNGVDATQDGTPSETLKVFYFKSNGLRPLTVQKVWDTPDTVTKAYSEIYGEIAFGLKSADGNTIQMYAADELTNPQNIGRLLSANEISVASGEKRTWQKVVYTRDVDIASIEEYDNNGHDLTPSYVFTDDQEANSTWVSVDSWDRAYLRFTCSDPGQSSAYSNAGSVSLIYRDADGVYYRSTAMLGHSENLIVKGQTYYVPIPVPHNSDLQALLLAASNQSGAGLPASNILVSLDRENDAHFSYGNHADGGAAAFTNLAVVYEQPSEPVLDTSALKLEVITKAKLTITNKAICKIIDNGVEHVFGTLKAAVTYARNSATLGMDAAHPATIQMLVDYEIPTGDQVVLNQATDNFVITSAKKSGDGESFFFAPTFSTEQGRSIAILRRGGFTDASMFAVTASGAALDLVNITLDGNSGTYSSTVDGGIVRVANGGSLIVESGAALRNSATTANGGAVYAASGSWITVTGGTINGNTAANGAGIYLAWDSADNHAILNLSGDPSFGGTDRKGGDGTDKDDLKGTEGNFVRKDSNDSSFKTEDKEPTNGSKPYPKNGASSYLVRQDIYIHGTASPHNAIRVTGEITSGDGTIWVWANNADHYEMLKQFAVFDGTGIDMSDNAKENSMKAFRNAQPDSNTNCGGDYLTGQKGDDVNGWKCIYWTGGFDVVFLKTDSYGGWKLDTNGNKISEGLPGAVFTLYTDDACTTPYEMTFTSGDGVTTKNASSTSSDGTATYKDKNGVSVTLEKGEVLLSKVPPKIFYLKETTPPSGYDRVENKTTVYQVEVSSTGELTMRRKDASGEYKEILKEKRREVTENGVQTDLIQYVVMNIPEAERKVILRKVNNTYASLQGAQFQIFRYDGTQVSSNNETTFTSGANGVYFIDKLPYGVYYLHETKAPTGYADDKWFFLVISNDTADGSRDGAYVSEAYDTQNAAKTAYKAYKPASGTTTP